MSRTHRLRRFEKFNAIAIPGMIKRQLDFSSRYSEPAKHRKQCAKAHQKTNGICVVCMARPSEQIHHSSYRKSGDRVGVNIFSTCKHCHVNICHHSKNWIIHPINPVWKNHNTASFTKMLQSNYRKLQQRRTR